MSVKARERAANLASKEIDKLKAHDIGGEEHHQRKRHLIKGAEKVSGITRPAAQNSPESDVQLPLLEPLREPAMWIFTVFLLKPR